LGKAISGFRQAVKEDSETAMDEEPKADVAEG
jgi:Sec-independent protein translocase protein TatA